MEPGQVCRLHLTDRTGSSPSSSRVSPTPTSSSSEDAAITVTVVVVAVRRHAEDPHRLLHYVHCTHIDLGAELARQRKKAAASAWHGVAVGAIGCGTMHRRNVLRVSTSSFVSSDGYHYRFDGWYEASALQCVEDASMPSSAPPSSGDPQQHVTGQNTCDDAAVSSALPETRNNHHLVSAQRRPVAEEWVAAMERDTAVCEVVYLCYAFQPWFLSPYTALQYLALPEEDVCHSAYWCHRCLSPFFTREQYYVHLEGQYCLLRGPPGRLFYHDEDRGYKAFLIDGAMDLHYCRCLSLLGKHFIESKLLANDVDLYEYVVVTTPRASLPFYEDSGVTAEEFSRAAADFDKEDWDGDAVMGYFSRLKHHPDHTLSCIVTLPLFQRRRVATFLLDTAYWMTRERQRQCGQPRCCGRAGGAISRPFSPHGQSLLLSYWRRALLRALDDVAPRRRASRTPQAEPTFTLHELRDKMDIAIHADDLEMLLLQSEFTFYAASGGRAVGGDEGDEHRRRNGDGGGVPPTSPPSSKKLRRELLTGGHGVSPSSPSSPPLPPPQLFSGQRYTATMVLEGALLDAAQQRPAKASRSTLAVFEKRWLLRDAHGVYAYDVSQFHY
ncbi:putative Moz/SAS family acetyltransferase [Leptomonas pyrrhocoris]|uniref:Histone acetyltransferase n=1 Tax=Leptomonas pyrrhocoris TaxID=157538 RepID=A0A0M9FV75_LEPPY|nr:putative Moz/SAS family acetyltransferase [Leptomonas pyrrhocoris]KPA76556.1 putative Moz/SAS family acetyltransferase [Leptomonas pyrrhocoris]|eukprot:XP_015654995.1 putative Moz/SAS family acetyltransferase [Leptomonas pyrrhocoris]